LYKLNDTEEKVLFAEVKRNPSKISLTNLRHKSQSLQRQFKDYQFDFVGLSLEDID